MDDSEEKISRIRSVLTKKCLVDNKDIDEAHSLNSGRKKLSTNFYDLLLLDLILPVGDNEDIEPGKSENFINELANLGITSFIFFFVPTILSIIVVYFLTKRFMTDKERKDN